MRETNRPAIIHRFTNEEIELSHNQMIQFVTAIMNKDLKILESVLHENFTYFDTKSKCETLEYFKRQFATEVPSDLLKEDVGMYFCTRCQPGNPALMFHNGYWPILENEQNLPKSLMLSFKDGLISGLTFCYGFCNAERLQEIAIQN
jgi:hypothetical protein